MVQCCTVPFVTKADDGRLSVNFADLKMRQSSLKIIKTFKSTNKDSGMEETNLLIFFVPGANRVNWNLNLKFQ